MASSRVIDAAFKVSVRWLAETSRSCSREVVCAAGLGCHYVLSRQYCRETCAEAAARELPWVDYFHGRDISAAQ